MTARPPSYRRAPPHGLRLVLALLLALQLASPAAAQPQSAEIRKAEALATQGKVFFRGKLYKEAALQFMEAFAISRRPTLVYNAARAYQEGGFDAKAIALFKHYLSLPGVDEGGKAAARKHLGVLEARVAEKQAREKAAADAAKAKAEAARKAAAAKAANEAKAAAAARRAREAKAAAAARAQAQAAAAAKKAAQPRERRVPKVWTGVAGGLLVASLSCYGVALSHANDMSAADVVDPATRKRYLQNRDKALAWRGAAIGAGVAAAGVAGWAAWQWWTSGQPKRRASLWLQPSAGPGSVGLIAGGRF